MSPMTLGWAWHVHHDVLCEPLREPIEARREFIRQHKPPHEIETRLRLLQPVRGAIPVPVAEAQRASAEAQRASAEAQRASDEAWRAYDEARRASAEAWRAYDRVWRTSSELVALHAAECPDCPWNGHTIFP